MLCDDLAGFQVSSRRGSPLHYRGRAAQLCPIVMAPNFDLVTQIGRQASGQIELEGVATVANASLLQIGPVTVGRQPGDLRAVQ